MAIVPLTIAGLSARFAKGDRPSPLPFLFSALYSSPAEGASFGGETTGVSGVITRASCCGQDAGGALAPWGRLLSNPGLVPGPPAPQHFPLPPFPPPQLHTP